MNKTPPALPEFQNVSQREHAQAHETL
jgi:hypothetical protein